MSIDTYHHQAAGTQSAPAPSLAPARAKPEYTGLVFAERIVEEMRLLGREAMQGWAETQVKATEKEIRQQPSMHRQGKKNSAGIRNLAKSKF